jgi:hypothetical protein
MEYFKQWCHLPLVQGTIDDTHIFISKPSYFSEYYFYFKTWGYFIVVQKW